MYQMYQMFSPVGPVKISQPARACVYTNPLIHLVHLVHVVHPHPLHTSTRAYWQPSLYHISLKIWYSDPLKIWYTSHPVTHSDTTVTAPPPCTRWFR